MKYEVGDKVLIKDINWYNKNKDEDGDISCGEFIFVSHMSKFCGKILTIDVVFEDGTYLMKEDTDGFVFTNEMFDTFAEEEVERLTGNLSNSLVNEFELPDGYIFKDENGNVINATKIILEKKKKEYPKTYEECRDLIEGSHVEPFCADLVATGYLSKLMERFARLIICRDAYWKLYGEEIGLGKPWKPDWCDTSIKYCLERDFDAIDKNVSNHKGRTFAFPTEEMRDTFKKNFDPDIEFCKELL